MIPVLVLGLARIRQQSLLSLLLLCRVQRKSWEQTAANTEQTARHRELGVLQRFTAPFAPFAPFASTTALQLFVDSFACCSVGINHIHCTSELRLRWSHTQCFQLNDFRTEMSAKPLNCSLLSSLGVGGTLWFSRKPDCSRFMTTEKQRSSSRWS